MMKFELILIMIFLLTGCTNLEGPFTVQEVIDGDTIKLEDSRKIRFSGINTPELSKNECYAKEAKNFILELEGKEVYLEEDFVDKDKYGRYLRYVHYKNINLNFLLIEEGYAKSYDQFKESTKYSEEIKELEEKAKLDIKGLWTCDYEEEKDSEVLSKKLFNWKKGILISLLSILYIFLNTMLP